MKLKSLTIIFSLFVLNSAMADTTQQAIETEFNQVDHLQPQQAEPINLQFSEKPDADGNDQPMMLSENDTRNKIESVTAAGEHQTTIIDESGNLRIIETPESRSKQNSQKQTEQESIESPGAMPEGPGVPPESSERLLPPTETAPAPPPLDNSPPVTGQSQMPPNVPQDIPQGIPQPPPPAMPAYPEQMDTMRNPNVQGTYPGPQQGAYPGTTPSILPRPNVDAFPNVPPSAQQFPHQPESITMPPPQGPIPPTGEVISPGRGQNSMQQNFPAGQDTQQNFLPGYQVPSPDRNQPPMQNQQPNVSEQPVVAPNQPPTVIDVPNPQTNQRWSN